MMTTKTNETETNEALKALKAPQTLKAPQVKFPPNVIRCAWCSRLKDENGIPYGQPISANPNISDGICLSCRLKLTPEGQHPNQP